MDNSLLDQFHIGEELVVKSVRRNDLSEDDVLINIIINKQNKRNYSHVICESVPCKNGYF